MSENHQINLNINAAGAKRGASEWKAAITQITEATKAYKTAMDQLGGTKTKVDFARTAKELGALGNIRINSSSAKNIAALSAALRGFRGPSASQIKSTRDFLRVVASAQVNATTARSIASISQAFAGFRGPTRNNSAAIRDLFKALNGSRLNPQTASHLAAITAALANFRGPSAAAVRNIDSLVNSLNKLRTPPNLNNVAASMNAIANAGARANASIVRQLSSLNAHSSATRTASGSTFRLTGNLRGLENAFSLSYQAGSQLRVLLGSLTLGQFTQSVYNATLSYLRFETAMGVASNTIGEQRQEMEFATATANKYGLALSSIYDEYGKFATAAKLAGQTTENTQYVFESVSAAMRVMGVDAMGQARSFKALTQMFSKGAVMAEELRQQLGEQLPAAFPLMQEALSEFLGKPVDLSKMLELGQVSDDAVVLLAKKLAEVFGPQIMASLDRADTKIGRLQNSWVEFQKSIGDNGVMDAFGDVARSITEVMESAEFKGTSVAISQAMGEAIRALGEAAVWALGHVKELGAAVVAMVASGAVASIAKLVSMFGMIGSVGGVIATTFAAVPLAIGAAVGALTYYWNELVTVGDQTVAVSTLATQAWYDIKDYITGAITGVEGFSLQGIIDWIVLADDTSASGFNNIAKNGELTAEKIKTVFGNMAQIIAAMITKAFLQFGVGANKVIANAARSMDYYTAKLFQPWRSEESLLADYNKNLANDVALLNQTLDNGTQAIDNFFGVQDAKTETLDILKPVAEQYAKRAKEMQEVRDAEARSRKAAMLDADKDAAKQQIEGIKNIDVSGLDPLRGDKAGGKDAVSKRLKEAEQATKDYRAEIEALNQQLQAGKITLDQYNAGVEYQARVMQGSSDPYAAMVRSMQDEMSLQGMATRAREIEIEHRAKINELAEKGIHVTAEQSAKLRELIATQQKMNNRPLKDWVDGIEDVGVATDRVAVTAMEGLSDQIADLVVTGKADFASLAQSILKDFIKIGIQSMMKDTFGKWFGGTETAAQQMVSTPASSAAGANAFNLSQQSQGWEMKGGLGLNGFRTQDQAASEGLSALNQSAMTLRGGFDYLGNSTGPLQTSISGVTPQIDAMTTGAINAANALNTLAGAAGQNPAAAAALSQPFPGQAQAAAATSAPTLGVTTSPARVAATPFNFSNKTLTLTPQEITDLKKTLMTEVDAGLKGGAYDSQASGVVDTIMNRKVSGRWGNSVTDVVNAKSQFSDINGPVAWKSGRGGVEYLSDSLLESGRGKKASDFVDQYLEKRMNGAPSSVGGNLHYANPNFSDKANRAWIDKLQGPTLGEGNRTHKHGTTAGFQPVDPNYAVRMAGQPQTSTPGIQGIDGLNWNGKMMQDVKGLTLHHTGGRGTPQDVISTLNKRGFGAQYIMDREGKVFQTVPDGAQVSHMKNAQNGSGLNNSNALGIEMIAKDNNDLTPAQITSGQQWIEQMREKYPGIGNNVFGHGELNSHKQETEGMGVVNAWRENQQQSAAVDPTVTSSIQQVNTQLQTMGQNAQQAATQTQSAQQMTTVANQQKMASEQQAGMSVQTAGQQALQAAPGFQQAGQSISSASQQASQAQPGFQQMSSGLGALLGPLSSVIPGLGQFGGAIMSLLGSLGSTGGMGGGLFGLFKEGGIATEPVSLGKMPHFAEGTANTGSYGRGGIPSVLHPNEAVIPLSRGRKVPVEMNNREEHSSTSEFAAAKQGGGNTFNLNLSGIKSADDFKRSQRQISQRLAYAQERTQRRNS